MEQIDKNDIITMGDYLDEYKISSAATGVVPDLESTPNAEFEQIIKEFKLSDLLGEISRYRIWRLRKSGDWAKIVDDSGIFQFNLWEDFISHVIEILHCSRQQMFDRLRVYEQLNWLGYTAEESIMMVTDQPSLYTRVLGKVMDWDQRKEEPRSISLPDVNNTTTKEKAQESVRNLLNEVTTFDTQKDALKYISETVLLEPQVSVFYNGDTITVEYYQQSIDKDGGLQVEGYGKSVFYPSSDLPDWVREALMKIIRSKNFNHE